MGEMSDQDFAAATLRSATELFYKKEYCFTSAFDISQDMRAQLSQTHATNFNGGNQIMNYQ